MTSYAYATPSGRETSSTQGAPQNNKDENWRYGMFDCFTSPSWCLIGWVFPSTLIYGIMEKTKSGKEGKDAMKWMAYNAIWGLSGLIAFAIGFQINIYFGAVLLVIVVGGVIVGGIIYVIKAGQFRTHIRARYGIEGDEWMDYVISFFCGVAGMNAQFCQMFYEVHSREQVEIV